MSPTAAVSSDLVAAMVMKPVGGGVHIRRRTVRWELVKWLCVGSIPAAFAGVFLLHATDDSRRIEEITRIFVGATLLLAAAAMVIKAWLQGKRTAAARRQGLTTEAPSLAVRVLPTVAVGIGGGLLVGLTSVGSGSIIIICLMLLYPSLRGAEIVGTDLVQAVPLVASAALAHIIFGNFNLGLTASIVLGSLPAVWLGARVSTKAPDWLIRPILVLVLIGSSLKLLGVPSFTLGVLMVTITLVALPLWGAVDAAGHPEAHWETAGFRRSRWMRMAWLAPIGIGFPYAVAYFTRVRPQLIAAATPRRVPEVLG